MCIRIGTRKSKLALWQANLLKSRIQNLGLRADLVLIDSIGDIDKTSMLGTFNQTGIFTRSLDKALLENQIDLAIHSLKDYPTVPPKGISITSTGRRENPLDVIVKNNRETLSQDDAYHIGTGSIRRKAQWKYKFPNSEFHSLRGNVPTRLAKMEAADWDGIILAYAGLHRLDLLNDRCEILDWMIPAPAQGILGISYRSSDAFIQKMCHQLQEPEVEMASSIERKFLNLLEGGCSAPIGALAEIQDNQIHFKGCLHDPDGSAGIYVEKTCDIQKAEHSVSEWVESIISQGGDRILEKLNRNNG